MDVGPTLVSAVAERGSASPMQWMPTVAAQVRSPVELAVAAEVTDGAVGRVGV